MRLFFILYFILFSNYLFASDNEDICKIEKEYSVSFNKSVNGISEEGNNLIFNKLIGLIQSVLCTTIQRT